MLEAYIRKGNDAMHKQPMSFLKGTLKVSRARWEL